MYTAFRRLTASAFVRSYSIALRFERLVNKSKTNSERLVNNCRKTLFFLLDGSGFRRLRRCQKQHRQR